MADKVVNLIGPAMVAITALPASTCLQAHTATSATTIAVVFHHRASRVRLACISRPVAQRDANIVLLTRISRPQAQRRVHNVPMAIGRILTMKTMTLTKVKMTLSA